MSFAARFASAINEFMGQYWLSKVAWSEPEKAYMQCAVATEAVLKYFLELGFEDLYYVEVLGGRDFDPVKGHLVGSRHYHTLARVGNTYIDLTYRQFEGQEDTPWPLIMDMAAVDDKWVKRREIGYGRNFSDLYTEWDELYK